MSSARIYFTPFASSNPPEQVRTDSRTRAASCAASSGDAWGCGMRRGWSSCSTTTAEDAARLTRLIDEAVAGDQAGAPADEGAAAVEGASTEAPQR